MIYRCSLFLYYFEKISRVKTFFLPQWNKERRKIKKALCGETRVNISFVSFWSVQTPLRFCWLLVERRDDAVSGRVSLFSYRNVQRPSLLSYRNSGRAVCVYTWPRRCSASRESPVASDLGLRLRLAYLLLMLLLPASRATTSI